MKRPCYLAGGTTEREDPPSGSHVVTHIYIYIYTQTHTLAQRARARQRRTECRRKGMRACERRSEEKVAGMVWVERGRVIEGDGGGRRMERGK